jgi:hypothetical protein
MVRVSQCTTGVSNFEAKHACERWRAPHRGRRGTEFRTGVATGARAVGDPTADVVNGVTGTAMNAVNAILALCGAAPGLRSYLDMPFYTGLWGQRFGHAAPDAVC